MKEEVWITCWDMQMDCNCDYHKRKNVAKVINDMRKSYNDRTTVVEITILQQGIEIDVDWYGSI